MNHRRFRDHMNDEMENNIFINNNKIFKFMSESSKKLGLKSDPELLRKNADG